MIADITRAVMQTRAKRNRAERIVEAIELTTRLERRVELRLDNLHKDRKRYHRLAVRWLSEAKTYAARAKRLRNFVERESAQWASTGNLIASLLIRK